MRRDNIEQAKTVNLENYTSSNRTIAHKIYSCTYTIRYPLFYLFSVRMNQSSTEYYKTHSRRR
jgi:hypothetical protein